MTNDYGIEAVDTLVKAMEDPRDDLIVIVDGYQEQMKYFIQVNPGLKYRFKKYIYFKAYDPDELELSARALFILKDNKMTTLGDLMAYLETGRKVEELEGMNSFVAENIIDDVSINPSIKEDDDEMDRIDIDELLMQRHIAKKVRRSSKKNHLKGPAKRTPEDDQRFWESFERQIRKASG